MPDLPVVAATLYSTTSYVWGFLSPHPNQHLVLSVFLNYSCPSGCDIGAKLLKPGWHRCGPSVLVSSQLGKEPSHPSACPRTASWTERSLIPWRRAWGTSTRYPTPRPRRHWARQRAGDYQRPWPGIPAWVVKDCGPYHTVPAWRAWDR